MWKNMPTKEDEKFFKQQLADLGFKADQTARYVEGLIHYMYATGLYAELNKDRSAIMAAALLYAKRAGKHIPLDENKITARYHIDIAAVDKAISNVDGKFADDFISGRIKI